MSQYHAKMATMIEVSVLISLMKIRTCFSGEKQQQ